MSALLFYAVFWFFPTFVLKAVHPIVMRLGWETVEGALLEVLHGRGWFWGDSGWWRA